jgi:phage terminase large subunit-like protein
MSTLTPEQTTALKQLAGVFGYVPTSLEEFAETRYYIPETGKPIILLPHQKAILQYALNDDAPYQTIVYSTVKKSGKTAIAALVARWIAETWGKNTEVYLIANDYEQARGRVYQKALESIELTPGYNVVQRQLPGRWKIVERQATYLPTHSIMRAVSSDYKGEAGSNPTATFWSELWGYSSETARRLWDELTPVPTRKRSIRYVETYAGFEDESDLLIDLYKLAMQGRRLTHDDIDWPFPDQPPIWVNERARMFAYWDQGEVARRMPWQTADYYQTQEATLRPQAYQRLHLNLWTSSVSEFLPLEWWTSNETNDLPAVQPLEPIILGVDAAVSSDCCAIVAVSRDPKNHAEAAIRFKFLWTPPPGGYIDLTQTIEKTLRDLCKRYNVLEIAYDAYQLHKLMTDLRTDAVAWCRSFSQAGDRSLSDKQLYDLIRDRRLAHPPDEEFNEHIKNAAAKQSRNEDTHLRIVKKTAAGKIDLVIAASMAVYECLRLNI